MAGLGIELTTELRQTTKLTPVQLQTIEILQLNATQLEERVNSELMENPVLEVAEVNKTDVRESVEIDVQSGLPDEERFEEPPNYDRYDDHDY